MNYVYKIEDTKAELIGQTESFDKILTQDTFPAQEYHENTHAVLSYDETDGIHWEYVPYSPAELRERAYETEKLIAWDGAMLTVDEANDIWVKYDAEKNEKANELTILIAEAKASVRERYPDAE